MEADTPLLAPRVEQRCRSQHRGLMGQKTWLSRAPCEARSDSWWGDPLSCTALTVVFSSEALLCHQELPVFGSGASQRAAGGDGDEGNASGIS